MGIIPEFGSTHHSNYGCACISASDDCSCGVLDLTIEPKELCPRLVYNQHGWREVCLKLEAENATDIPDVEFAGLHLTGFFLKKKKT